MSKILKLQTLVVLSLLLFACSKDNKEETQPLNAYVTELIEYVPAPGQFINGASGNLEAAKSLSGKKGFVSLGAFGGYITLGFDHTVINKSNEADIIIYNNAMSTIAEPGVIYVMKDENKNGLADDTWYEIAGSEFNKPGYVRNYTVTYTRPEPATADVAWTDNQGNSGVVKVNTFHKQSYYPEWMSASSYTLTGSLLPSSGIDTTNPTFTTSSPFAFGYADNTTGGDQIDISDAIDANGNKVNLSGIDFIKIQTGIQADMGWLGELSTEILGVADLSMIP